MSKVKKFLAITTAATMVLGTSVTTFALPGASADITIRNAGESALFNYVQIVVPNQTTSTGWDIVNEYNDEFFSAFGYSNVEEKDVEDTEQSILNGMIFSATEGSAGSRIDGFDSKYATALDSICVQIEAPAPAEYDEEGQLITPQKGSGSPIQVSSAGVYVIRGYETGFIYGTMSAYVAFKPYDQSTGLPTDLGDTFVEAKREPEKTEKSSDDSDKVVEIGRTVTYTVTSTVPYIAPTKLDSAEYWFNDELQGAVYSTVEHTVDEGTVQAVKVDVVVGNYNNSFYPVPTNIEASEDEPAKQSISVDLTEILMHGGANAHANEKITITYQAVVTDTYTENSASTGKGKNESDFGTSTEKLFTGDVTMTKYAEDGTTTLSGAGFEVRKVVAGEFGDAQPLKFSKVGDGIYKYDPKGTETVTEVFTGSAGTVTLQGLDLGGYEFKETTAPEGYTINEETRVATITLKEMENGEMVEVAESEDDVIDGETDIRDTKLSSLPSTGGIGTTIFTIGGCLIMIVAAGLFFATRRKAEK